MTASAWLIRIHQRQRQRGPATVPEVVRVIPALAREARRRGLNQPFRIWCLLRELEGDRGGRLRKSGTIDALVDLGWGRSSVYRLMRKGMDIFWTEDMTFPHGNHGSGWMSVVLKGARALAELWEVERLSPYTVKVPWELAAHGLVGEWNAVTFHVQLPGPRLPRITKAGVQRPRLNHPYSKRKIREDTDVPERSQIRYHKLRLPGIGRAVTRRMANYATDRVERQSQAHHSWGQRRLGNSYTSVLERVGFGKGKAFNKEREAAPYASDAHGPSDTGRPRRFFQSARSLIRARQKGRKLYRDAMFRMASVNAPWNSHIGWWELPELALA